MCTRWNSSVEMLEHFLKQQPATLMSKNLRRGTEVHTLSEMDISNAENIVKVMEPIKIATTVMCEEEQPTVSVIAPLQAKLMKHLEPCENDTDMSQEMKSVMNVDLSSWYTNICNALLKDPCYKELEEKECIFLKLTLEASDSTQHGVWPKKLVAPSQLCLKFVASINLMGRL
ncbi:hypothetical protein PHYPO_G00046380 [Pangasianodon hypophthalmus]|uniref:Uncharacterized protein n=1 Tax=Pangasianodon hypophthalmus TaxID=310915 RepID=A0A5N5MGF6_PANHP|nr:hypothetical protein PHYPO_G00046380 [Pangasianodon hypophthalmus]